MAHKWKKINKQLVDIDGDIELFTNSKECDDMMEQYHEDMIKVLSGPEEKLPDWYGRSIEKEE